MITEVPTTVGAPNPTEGDILHPAPRGKEQGQVPGSPEDSYDSGGLPGGHELLEAAKGIGPPADLLPDVRSHGHGDEPKEGASSDGDRRRASVAEFTRRQDIGANEQHRGQQDRKQQPLPSNAAAIGRDGTVDRLPRRRLQVRRHQSR